MKRLSPLECFIIVSSVLVGLTSCAGLYTIVAPQHIRPHHDYKISLTLHDGDEPVTICLSIQDGLQYKNAKNITINSNKTELVTLHIDELDVSKNYKFVAEGISGITFRDESKLKIESKNASIFIQTDKAIYKPGETIKFRVLILDYELKPFPLKPNNPLNIYFSDPERNRIKQWLNVTTNKSVFTSEIQLSELPTLGNWKFEAQVGTEKKSKAIEVAEYVLPIFDVAIDSPTEFSVKSGKVRAIIRSKYTYGKFVKGEAIVSLTPSVQNSLSFSRNTPGDAIIKTISIDGKGTIEFDIEHDLNVKFSESVNENKFELKAIVVEELSGRNESASKTITLHKMRYKIKTMDLNHEYTAGSPIQFSISISHYDSSPVLLNEQTKWITIAKAKTRLYIDPTYHKFELNENANININLPTLSNETTFFLKVKFMDDELNIGKFCRKVDKPSELEAKVLTKRPTLNEDVFIEVKSKHLLQQFTYQLIGRRGQLIYAENVAAPNHTSHTITFKATFDLVPKATLIVYCVRDNNIDAIRTEISIEDDLNNFIKLKLSTAETQPNTNVSIDVITHPDSYVGLVGLDQSVLLLKNNDGLTKQNAFDEMNSYQKIFHPTKNGAWNRNTRGFIDEYFKPFEKTNLILFTNAIKKVEKPKPIYRYPYTGYRYRSRPWHGAYFGSQIRRSDFRSAYHSPVPSVRAMSAKSAVNGLEANIIPLLEIEDNTIATKTLPENDTPIEPTRIRTEFPETWLWEDIDVNNPNGSVTFSKKVPDTITSWVISAFSVNEQFGLGLTKNPKTLNVFQPFFVSLNLPYSVKRGEVVAVPVILFNYLNTDTIAELTLQNENGSFEFVDDNENDHLSRIRQVSVASNSGTTQIFLVKFTSVGEIPLKVTATSAVAGDAIVRILRVDPEGVPQFVNKAVLIDLRETDKFELTQTVDVPQNAVPASLKVKVNAFGDLLSGTIQNLHQLIRLPTGCGEQNMMKFVPNIVVLDYLRAVDNLDSTTKDKAIKYLLSGYQRELTYRHNDGSYSVFGKSDGEGSTWLTAFVAKSFKQAEDYIDIDRSVIDKALEFLSKVQIVDGSFPEMGRIYDKAIQGGANKGIALTAYTTIAFLKNKNAKEWKYDEVVNKSISYITENLKEIDGQYALAIAVYTLQLAEHPEKQEALENFIKRSIDKDGMKWWSNSKPNECASDTIDVEITSYGLLALIEAKRYAEALPYFKWLLSKRNDRGGFIGTQDTVIGLESLAAYSRSVFNKNNNVEFRVHTDNVEDQILKINHENGLILQSIDLPSQTQSVRLSASGQGTALFQLSYRYNLNESDVYQTFTLRPKVLETTAGHLNVEICARFNAKSEDGTHSNMVIVEVGMPSGFLIEKDHLNGLLNRPHVKLVETKSGETVTNIYIDQMLANEQICLEVQGYRSHKVAENKPVPVKIYDYYDNSRSAREFYEIPFVSSCDICEGDACFKSCKK